MLEHFTTAELLALHAQGEKVWRSLSLLQAAEADVEPPRPGLAGRAGETLRLLLTPLDELVRDLLGEAAQSAGLAQAHTTPAQGEEAAALRYLGLSLDVAGRQYDAAVGKMWDTHLQRWERRHHEVVDRVVQDMGQVGRGEALAEIGLEMAESIAQTAAVWARIPARFEGVGASTAVDLRRGTLRTSGLIDLIDRVRTVGAAALYLRRLYDATRPVLEQLAEHVTWGAYAEGYRLAAIDGTHAILREAGALPGAGGVLTEAGLPADVLERLPRYRWSGPQDTATCGPCQAHRQQVVYALDVDGMPSCQVECAHGMACRHHWSFISPSSRGG